MTGVQTCALPICFPVTIRVACVDSAPPSVFGGLCLASLFAKWLLATASILQGIKNAKAEEKLLEANAKLKELSFYKESQTMNDVINGIRNQVEIQAETLESLKMQNEITQATLQDKIQQIKGEAIQIFLVNICIASPLICCILSCNVA